MTDPTDPTRLSESGSAGVKELLASAAVDAPTEAELVSLNAAMGPMVGAQAVAATSTTTSSALLKLTVLKTAMLVGVGVGAIGGVMWWTATPEEDPAPATLAPAPVISDPTAPVIHDPFPDPTTPDEPDPAPEIEPPPPAPVPTRVPSADTAPSLDPADDIALLRQARQAFRDNDPALALALSAEHRQGFPDSSFTQEREAIAIEALARTGRRGAAQRQYERFSARWPQSTYRHRLETLLEEPASDP